MSDSSLKEVTVFVVCKPPFFDIFVKLNKHKIYIKDSAFTSNLESFKNGNHHIICTLVEKYK